MILPELLAPAGSFDCMKAAAAAGADAVYMGGLKFGARAYAENASTDDYLRAIDRMHVRNKKIYLTLNTLLKDSEIPEIEGFLRPLYNQGLDAVIVQDVGVIQYLTENFPKLPIHLSTQMTVNTANAANAVKELSKDAYISRVVPSRELSLEEIKKMREETGLELECFVHGALCYCYSGQCLMSSLFGGRSGNRGRCAQPCRLEYEMNGQTAHFLSPKDICTIEILPDLIEAGIDSFKIEGRMKGVGYVSGVTEGYRTVMDKYGELGGKGYREYVRKHPEFIEKIMFRMLDLYNRGSFSHGFYDCAGGKSMMAMTRPNHNGVLVGTVEKIRGINAAIRLERKVGPQDILEIRSKDKTVYEFTVGTGEGAGELLCSNFKPGSDVAVGNSVYRTRNQGLLDELEDKYLKNEPKIPIKGAFTFKPGEPMKLTCVCKRTEYTVTGDAVDEAKSRPMDAEMLRDKLTKTGETPFEFEELEIDAATNGFTPVGKLNELRRTCLEGLEKTIAEKYRREPETHEEIRRTVPDMSLIPERTRIQALVSTEDQLYAAAASDFVDDIYIDITDLAFEKLNDYCDRVSEKNKGLFLAFPRILRANSLESLTTHQGALRNPCINGYLIRNLDCWPLVSDLANRGFLKLITDWNLYAFNSEAKDFWKRNGAMMTASLELSARELKELDMREMVLPVYGRVPLMVTAQCLNRVRGKCLKAEGAENKGQMPILTDRMQKEMPVLAHCNYCFSTIHNSDTYALMGCSAELRGLAPYALRLDFTMESGKETANVLKTFEEEWKHGVAPDKSFFYRKTAGSFRRGTE